MHERRKELETHMDGKKPKQRQVRVIYRDSNSDSEIHRKITSGAKEWRKVEGG